MTSTAAAPTSYVSQPPRPPTVELVVPVHNEERDLVPGVRRLHAYLSAAFPFSFRITIADNASTDSTWRQARQLASELAGVRAVRYARKGRGHALYEAWSASDAAVLAYTDVDLSTDLAGLLPLVAPLVSGHSDVAIGSRLARGARVTRGARRQLISRGYNLLLHGVLGTRFSDAQCGFKAVRADVARELLPLVEDRNWFFDTELLVLAERSGLRIHEVPVDWVDDLDSRVALLPTIVEDLRGIARLGRGLLARRIPLAPVRQRLGRPATGPATELALPAQLARFAVVGAASTVAYLLLYVLLRLGLGPQPANALALLSTALANTAANRRWTFGRRGRTHAGRHQARGLVAFAAGLALSSGALGALHTAVPRPGRPAELAALVVANVLATLLRFALYRVWVFRDRRPAASGTDPAPQADLVRSA